MPLNTRHSNNSLPCVQDLVLGPFLAAHRFILGKVLFSSSLPIPIERASA